MYRSLFLLFFFYPGRRVLAYSGDHEAHRFIYKTFAPPVSADHIQQNGGAAYTEKASKNIDPHHALFFAALQKTKASQGLLSLSKYVPQYGAVVFSPRAPVYRIA